MQSQISPLVLRVVAYALGASTLFSNSGCSSKASIDPADNQRMLTDLNADVFPSLATLLASEEKLSQFVASLDRLGEEDYEGLKGQLIKASQGNVIKDFDQVRRILDELHLDTGEFDQTLLTNLVRLLKESEARPVLQKLHRDLGAAERDRLQELATAYTKTKEGQALIKALRERGVNIQEQEEYKLMAYLLWTLGIVSTVSASIFGVHKYRQALEKRRGRFNNLQEIHTAAIRAKR